MPTSRTLVCAGLLSGLLLAAPDAEARFGKRSASGSSDSGSKKSKTHEATAVGEEDSDDDDDGSSASSSSSRRGRDRSTGGAGWLDVFVAVANVASSASDTPTTYVTPEPVAEPEFRVETRPESAPLGVRMGANGAGLGGGSALGLFLGIEGEMLGISTHYTGLVLPTDDGTPGTDEISLIEANLTFALWASPRGRWRLEVGLSGASAPDIGFVGPTVATSLEACLAGPLDLEGRVQLVPFPYRQLDAQAGLAVHMQALTFRAGWRGLVLDDAGYVDGERHVDVLTGPYAGIGLAF